MLQLEADIEPILPGEDGFSRSRLKILEWLSSKGRLPSSAWAGETFAVPADLGVPIEALNQDIPRLWSSLLIEPDREVPGRNWINEASLFKTESGARIAVRLSCSSRGEADDIIPGLQKFIPILIEEVGLSSDGERLTQDVIDVNNEEKIENLIDHIESGTRRLPIVVLSAKDPSASAWPFDAGRLARRIAGMGWVYRIGFEEAFALTRHFGKSWSVFRGACRMYMPEFDRFSQNPYDHPLLLSDEIHNEAWAIAWICRTVFKVSVGHSDIYKRLPRFHDIKETLARYNIQEKLDQEKAPAARIALLEEVRESLEAQLLEWQQLTALSEAEARECQEDLSDIKRRNSSIRERVEILEKELSETPKFDAESEYPEDYGEFSTWASLRFAGRLVLASKAQRAVSSSEYQDIRLVCEALSLLAFQYRNMKRGGGQSIFNEGLRRLSLSNERIASNSNNFKSEE